MTEQPIDGGAAEPTGRNDPCPCGSGKKYKKCCLTKATVSARATSGTIILEVNNNGPEIDTTNFWTEGLAAEGKFMFSSNAKALRILVPEQQEAVVPEMKTGRKVIVSRGLHRATGKEMLEICFDDGSGTPFALTTSLGLLDFLPTVGERFTVSVWTKGPGTAALCQVRLPAKYRHVRKLPCRAPWRPEDEINKYYAASASGSSESTN